MEQHEDDPTAEARRKLMKQASLYTYGYIGTAVVIALGGAALVAFLLRGLGWGFLRTWLVIVTIVLVPPLLWAVFGAVRRPPGPRT
jgi:hypothetical protein